MEAHNEIRILLLEDNAEDAALVELALRRAGIAFSAVRVETREAFVAALADFRPDVVLADYKLPAFDGMAAVRIVRSEHPDVPVVMVTGALGDEGAVELLKAGARDYVLKDRLARLGPALRRSLAEERGIRARKQAERELAQRERYYRKLIEGSSDMFFVIDGNGMLSYRSESGRQLTGYAPEDVLGKHFMTYIAPESVPVARQVMADALERPGETRHAELAMVRRDGTLLELELVGRNLLDDPDVGGIVVTARDITERKQSERALARLNRALRTLSAGNAALVHADGETQLLESLCRVIVDVGGYCLAWIGYAEQDAARTVRLAARHGNAADFLDAEGITWAETERGRGPTGRAIRTGAIQVVQHYLEEPAVAPWHEAAVRQGIQACIALPLKRRARTYGCLTIFAREADAFDDAEVDLLSELANDVSFGIEAMRTRAERDRIAVERGRQEAVLRQGLEESIKAIADTVEMRDPYTAGHQRRVGRLAVAIARELDMPAEAVHGISLAASIHDVGKVSVPAEILSKPTRLTAVEFELVKNHAQAGYDILKGIQFPWPIATMVWQHHERMDGSGYPGGLRGDDILPGSRVLAVADVVEAIASHRPYRASLGVDAALGEIRRGRGTAYDEAAVDACLRLFAEQRFSFSDAAG